MGPTQDESPYSARANEHWLDQSVPEVRNDRSQLHKIPSGNDPIVAKNDLSDWPDLKAQDSVLQPLHITIPARSNFASTDSVTISGENERVVDPYVGKTLTSTANSSTEIPQSASEFKKTKITPLSEHETLITSAPKDEFIKINPQRSYTLESFRNFVRPARFSNESLASGHVATLGNILKRGLRPLSSNALEEQLKLATQPSNREHWSFLPESQLARLVTVKSIKKEFARKKYRSRKDLELIVIPLDENRLLQRPSHSRSRSDSLLVRKRSVGTYRKIFAILMFIRRQDEIARFLEAGVCDADLPLEEMPVEKGSVGQFYLRRQRYHELPLSQTCFKGWQEGHLRQFADYQWVVLSPTFKKPRDGTVPHYEFHRKEIMPFTWKPLAKGGFGQVYEARFHPHHHHFDTDLVRGKATNNGGSIVSKLMKSQAHHNVVAIKQLLLRNGGAVNTKEAFDREARILRNLSTRHTHPHLITLLATYEQNMNYFLIFPWADADLERFWETIKPEPKMARWVLEQYEGLASGLYKIHRYFTKSNTTMPYEKSSSHSISKIVPTSFNGLKLLGRHGDVKPQNILWYRDGSQNGGYGTLKITDFGIAQFTVDNNTDSVRRNGRVPNSPTYRSPECDIPDAPISSQCDIWALGCVYLVFTVWFFDGCKSVKRFANSRKYADLSSHNKPKYDEHGAFFAIEEDASGLQKATVKGSVQKMIDYLLRHRACDKNFRKLLTHVRDDMLIVHGPDINGYLKVSKEATHRRISSGNLATKLSSLQWDPP